ncbi:hypothetical protein [Streptomyces sp. AN091965]|uniref:hypothetical protein n=1 Tax=Streptomyces sp. AN091965 TaxID=2927803 RepID=UPI001F6025A7|nr:hypothetical protein [Streptomyces sp. AN091965]MCI3928837.1 hypothetical protein [Streptomyces sp. AN091965]
MPSSASESKEQAAQDGSPKKAKRRKRRAGYSAPTPPSRFKRALLSMARDPSMRTEAGRELLQLLISHSSLTERRWRRIIDCVPAHRAPTMAKAAEACAHQWLMVAEELSQREAQ